MSKRIDKMWALALLLLGPWGCGGPDVLSVLQEEGGPVAEGSAPRVPEGRHRMVIFPFDSHGRVTVRRVLEGVSGEVPFELREGELWLEVSRKDGVEEVTLVDGQFLLEDVEATAAVLPPDGLTLTELRLALHSAAPGRLRWYGGEGEASLDVELNLQGKLRTSSGATGPFESQPFQGVASRLALSVREDETLELRARMQQPGRVWTWANLLDSGDLHFDWRAFEEAKDPEAATSD